MAGNARFELKSASPDSGFAGNYSNGQRVSYTGPTLDRSGSFNEGAGNRMFGYGKGTSRASGTLTGDIPPVLQCLILEQIPIGEPKYNRSVELRRVLGLSVGSTSEDNSFGPAHLKPSPPVSMDEVKRFRANLIDTCSKASGRAKKFDELLHRLNKYNEVNRKQQRNELLINERASASNLKMGTQIHRGPSELVTQKSDDRPKNGTLNKRVRTSVAETRSEYRSNGLLRQPVLMTKERDMHKDNNADLDMAEEKVRRLPAGGEGWDKKMKRKRSVGAVISRPIDDDGELKRNVHHKLSSEAGLPSCDSHGFRSGMPGAAGANCKSEGTSSPASSSGRALQSEQEKSTLSRDLTVGLNKEKFLAKGNIKLNSCEESNACPSPITKGKASRAPRSGSLVANNSASTASRVPGTLESWEQAPNSVKNLSVGGANNRKRPFPAGSSSPPITQWVGQRPQKISRTRRVNLVSPVSNNDEIQMPSADGCSPSDLGARLTTSTVNGPPLPKGSTSGAQNIKVKTESVLSPARLSESEESGAGENRLKEKGTGCSEGEEKAAHAIQNIGPSNSHMKKSKFLVKEEIGDGVRRQGRSGRVSSFTRGNISPTMEKLDNLSTSKPLRPTRPTSEKNGSKSGRPLKKQSERKGFSRLGHPTSSGSPDFTGDSDDGREELLSAAKSAYNSNVHACSSAFWKKVEAFFASISSEEKFYLSDQLKSAEELHAKLTQFSCPENGVLGDHVQDEFSLSDTLSGDRDKCMRNQCGSKDSANADLVHKVQDSTSCAKPDSSKNFDKVTPLYQRVLSALIIEDDLEEFEENGYERSLSLQGPGDSPDEASPFIDCDSRNMDRTEFECESVVGVVQLEKNRTSKFASCNGYGTYTSNTGIRDSPYSNEMRLRENGFMHSEIGLLVDLSRCNSDGPQNVLTSSFSVSSLDCQYAQMSVNDRLLLELQSIGLYLEAVPDLEDKEDEVIDQEIMQLEKGLYQQIGKKKTYLGKMSHAIQEGKDVDRWDPEQVAMNKLVEVAYKKLLATRKASKIGVPKVSKQVALAFARRTLARCHKFEESGTSCFNDPVYRDIIFATRPRFSEAELLAGSNLGRAGVLDPYDNHQSDQAFARNGPLSNRGKKKEVLLDDVGGAAFRATSTLGGALFGGAKGKRSERDRDRDTSVRNANAKAGRSSLGNSKGDRKTKTKPKQKTAQLSTSGNGSYNKFLETTNTMHASVSGSGESVNTNGNMKKESNMPSNSREVKESGNAANLPLNDIDPIGELGVEPDLGAPQDFNSWFNFDVDGLADHDSIGLEIPMDDLSELNMF
nr:uncharacterized protein LOC109148070 [Ipomoea batatas]